MKMQEGYLTQESGSWLGHYTKWIVDPLTGEKKRRQLAFKIGPAATTTKTKAREALRERMVEELGITADSRRTVSWFIEHRWKPQREGTWRDSTKQTNEELLKIIEGRFGDTALEDMDGVAMQAWLTALAKTRSGSAVKHLRIFLRAIFREAAEQDYVRKDPARLLRVPKLKAVVRTYLSMNEVKALLKAAQWHQRERALLSFLLVTALRPSELFALKWKHFDMESGTLTLAETIYRGKVRAYTKTTEEGDVAHLTLHVPQAAVIALAKWHTETDRRADDDYIFPNTAGGYITKENFQRRILSPLAKQAGIKTLNFQILRRTVATHAQDLGSPKDISTIMRHRKVATAQDNYVQMIEASVKATAEKLATKMLAK